MSPWMAEFLGTMILILLGNGVVANVLLKGTKGNQAGWIVITAGWAMAVYIGAMCSEPVSGAHLNPALTLAITASGKLAWSDCFTYIIAQCAGAWLGAVLVYLFYRPHFQATEDPGAKLACFSTSANLPGHGQAFFCELVGTFVLVLAIFLSAKATHSEGILGMGALGLIPVALLVFAIGLSLGGTTGYAINPARDLMPRLAHHLLPIPGKGSSDWSYAWVPVAGPIAGGLLASLVHRWIGG